MPGALMQLVAYGAQDVYLTGNPQMTYWKVVYRRCTNFAMESIEQVFNGQGDFGSYVQCVVGRNGDLIHNTFLVVTLPEIDCCWTMPPCWDPETEPRGERGERDGRADSMDIGTKR